MQLKNYEDLAKFGKSLLGSTTLNEGLSLIGDYSKKIISAERSSIFIYDRIKDELWTTLADDIDKIVINSNEGLVGQARLNGKTIIENDTSSNPYFKSDIDKKSGFVTKNIIATPIFSSKRSVIGILELLNKDGGFNSDDAEFMEFFANFISGFIELAPIRPEN